MKSLNKIPEFAGGARRRVAACQDQIPLQESESVTTGSADSLLHRSPKSEATHSLPYAQHPV